MLYRTSLLIILTLIALLSLCISLFLGSGLVPTSDLLQTLVGKGTDLSQNILVLIRLPHALTAFITGGLLGLAGALMQVLIRNPLADPYVLGVSGGAAVVTLALMLLGFSVYSLTLGAWIGSLIAILLVLFLAKKNNRWDTSQLLLTGIALASGFSALISLILLSTPNNELRGMLFWLVGDLSGAHIPWMEALILLGGLLFSLSFARDLNILIRGDKEARALGVETQRLQWKLYLLSSLLAATAVTLAGCIGFIGLIVPHLCRLTFGYDHRLLLPGCVLLGGSLLTLADCLARTLYYPQQLPVGIVMVLIGIPIFILLLQKIPHVKCA